jgi:hypothetical protein
MAGAGLAFIEPAPDLLSEFVRGSDQLMAILVGATPARQPASRTGPGIRRIRSGRVELRTGSLLDRANRPRTEQVECGG